MDAIQIPFTDFGGQGKLLYFLHANGYPPACYLPLFNQLQKKFHIIGMHQRPLWPGEIPDHLEDWRTLAKDFSHFVSTREKDPIFAVGHSVGGLVLLRTALLEPSRFRGIVLIDPVLFPPSFVLLWNLIHRMGLGWKVHPMIRVALNRRRKFDNLELIYRGYRGRKIFRYFSDESLHAYIRGITRPDPNGGYELIYSPEWEARIYYTGVWRDLEVWRGLKTHRVPTLFIRGAASDTFKKDAAIRVKRVNPDIQVQTINESSHLVPLERPKEVADLILSFEKELL